MRLEGGLAAEASLVVGPDDTASRVGSGDVAVLATPVLLRLVEQAAVEAVRGALAGNQITVGSRVELEHLAPTPQGATVTARVLLDSVEGRTLAFSFEVADHAGPVGRGTHQRVVVDRDRFLVGAARRAGA